MSGLNVVVVRAIGQIDRVVRTLLVERDFLVETIRFSPSSHSSGTTLEWKGQHITTEDVATSDLSGIDIAILFAGASASREYAPKFAAQGAVVIGNSSTQRRDPEVPLVVSEVNPGNAAKRPKGIIANPNYTTVAAIPVLRPLVNKAGGLEHLFMSSYQTVSGSGIKDVQELVSQTRSGVSQGLTILVLNGHAITLPEPEVYVAPITFDVVPLTGSIVEDGGEETDEEQKLRNKSYRTLHIPGLHVSGTCVRVPVFTGHILAIHTEFSGAITADETREVLTSAPSVRLVEAPTPLEAVGRDEVLCGHTRQDQAVEGNRGLVLVLNGDNLCKGAALNAIQIAKVVAKGLLS